MHKQTLLEEIARDWATLNQMLDGLSETQWTEIKNPDGWAVKDHITHISAWERSVIAFLTNQPRHESLGVPEDLYLSQDYDAINHAIFLKHQNDPLEQARSEFAATHAEFMNHITALSDEDLQRPYRHYVPDVPIDGDGPPIISLVHVNSAPHYRDHQKWIEEQLK